MTRARSTPRPAGLVAQTFARTIARTFAALAATAGLASAQSAVRADSTGTIVGIVTMKDGGLPLAFSVASVPALGRERFSNEAGVFILGELPAGPVTIRVRHLGYSPTELAASVHAGRADTIRVQLSHIAVRLVAMQVRAYPECRNPGIPAASADSGFATVFDQLHQNAEQYRLLAGTYPFVFSVERMLTNTLVSGDNKMEAVDTITLESKSGWVYKPGALVMPEPGGFLGRGSMTMNIPTLVHFADRTFVDNHCFYNGGLETIEGADLIRIDFTAAARIRDPDVNGSMFLDPTTFQIRRSILRLSRIPRGLVGVREIEATTYFGELFPSIPVIAGIVSVTRLEPRSSRQDAITEAHEQQRLLHVHFLKGLPGADTKRP